MALKETAPRFFEMSEEDIAAFNWLEAAARVIILHTTKKFQYCVNRRYLAYASKFDDTSYRVRYRRGNHYVIAHVGEARIVFKNLRGAKNIMVIKLHDLWKYMEGRNNEHPPKLTIDQ